MPGIAGIATRTEPPETWSVTASCRARTQRARSQVCADTVSAVAKRKSANAFRFSLLSACAAARTGGRGSRRGRKLRRHRKVALIRRPVRRRQIVGRIEHGRPDIANLVVIDEEPFGQQIPHERGAGLAQEDAEAHNGLLLA